MTDLLLRDLDEGLLLAVRSRAAATGQSIEDKARELIRLGLLLDTEGRVAEAARIRGMSPRSTDDSTDTIRRMRNAK